MSGDGSVTHRRGGGGGGGGGIKMCEGWLEHRNHTLHGREWQRIWLVLRENVIYVFKTNDATQENQLGNLTIDRDTTFHNVPKGDQRSGFKFELKTGRRLNKFKTFKSSQREEWRAYVMALTTGTVPVDIDLLPPQIADIRRKVDAHLKGTPHRESTYSGGSQESGIGSVGGSVGGQSGLSGISRPYPGSSSGGSTGSPSSGSQMDMGGPFMVHRFYPDRADQRVPSWFFSNCSRHQAEEILLSCRNYGNTLIRESSTHKSNGSYVISKCFFNESKKRYEVEHYEVMRVAVGYRINVENQQPEMICLSAVMEYFVSTAGGSSKALETNDPGKLGLREPDYETRRIRGPPENERVAEPWQWPPPDYDRVDDRRPISDHRTVNPAVMYNRHSGQSQGQPSRWSNGQQQPATVAHYSSRRQDSRTGTRMDDIEHRVHQAEAISGLDDVIRGFQQDQIYVNADAAVSGHHQRGVSEEIRPQDPPPPLPHRPASHNYVNEGDEHSDSHATKKPPPPPPTPDRPPKHGAEASDIRSLPDAPPPPTYKTNKTPAAESSKSPAHLTSTPVNAQQAPAPHLHSSPSEPAFKQSNQSSTPEKFVAPPLKKSVSDNAFKATPKTPGSPASFPTWTEPKSVLKNTVNQSAQSQNSSAQSESDTSGYGGSGTSDSTGTSGIDDTNPGGVRDLKSMFETKRPVSSSVLSPTTSPGKASPAPGRVRTSSWSSVEPSPSTSTPDTPTHSRGMRHSASLDVSSTNTFHNGRTNTSQRPLPPNPDDRVSARSTATNTGLGTSSYLSRQRVIEDEDDIYDDTAVGDTVHPTEKKVAFEQVDQPSSTARSADERRKTEPALSIPKGQFQGLSEEFKRKLENTIGSSNTVPSRPQSMPPGKLQPHQQESEYEELPEIPPDSVTYVNDKFNK